MEKCIACGMCAEKCPKKVEDLFNESLITRKAIYVPYSQAVPLKYTIDAENCIYFTKGKCRACEKFCPAGAINFKEEEKTLTLQVGSLILALGFTSFDPARFDTYAYPGCGDIPGVRTHPVDHRTLRGAFAAAVEHARQTSRRKSAPKNRLAAVCRLP